MAKVSVPNCGTCNKVSDIVIVWLRTGDTEWTCLDCHLAMVLAMVADQTELPEPGEPVAAG